MSDQPSPCAVVASTMLRQPASDPVEAAGHDLYTALENLRDLHREPPLGPDDRAWARALDRADGALAEAEGRPQ